MLFICLPDILHFWVAADSFAIPQHDSLTGSLLIYSHISVLGHLWEILSLDHNSKLRDPQSCAALRQGIKKHEQRWTLDDTSGPKSFVNTNNLNSNNHSSRMLDPDSLLMTNLTWFPWPSRLWLFFAPSSLYPGSLGTLASHWQLPCAWLTCLLND